VLCDAIVDENVHAAVLTDYVAKGVPDFMAKGWDTPSSKKGEFILVISQRDVTKFVDRLV